MSGDVKQFLQQQREDILKAKAHLGLIENKFLTPHLENKENIPVISYDTNPKETVAKKGDSVKFGCEKNPATTYGCGDKESEGLGRRERNEKAKFKNVPPAIEPLDLTRCYYDPTGLEEEEPGSTFVRSPEADPYSYRSSDEGAKFDILGGGAPFGLPSLRRGEYAPLLHTRLKAAPHIGLGEYELERNSRPFFRRSGISSLRHAPKTTSRSTNTECSGQVDCKSVQTDIQNIENELVVKQHGYDQSATPQALSPRRTVTDELVDAALHRGCRSVRYPRHHIDQRLTSAQNELLLRAIGSTASTPTTMDKPKSILSNRRTGSPRDRYAADQLAYGSTSFIDGFSYSDRNEELERERLKRESYQHELRLQIEEKRHLAALREEQERKERELEQRRLDQQLLRMREEQVNEDRSRQKRHELMRRHSDDLLRRKAELHELQRPWRRHADSESANLDSVGLGLYGYSPPVGRRGYSSSYNVPATSVFSDPSATSRYHPNRFESSSYQSGILRKPENSTLRQMESLNSYDTVPLPRSASHRAKFDRFDSLSRIDSLSHRLETMSVRDNYTSDLTDLQRRHSATQQDLSLSRSPRLRRRNSSSRFEESLPIPVLKARSPVAKELRNAVPFSSHRSSDAHRRLEDRWQIPAVQKTILDSPIGSRGSILTQLGSIRAQLQREQLRMDESLRRQGMLRTRTEDY